MRNASQDEDAGAVDDRGREYVERHRRFPANAAGFMIAPGVWFVFFVAVYSLQGAGCAAGLDSSTALGIDVLRSALLVTTAIAAAVLALTGLWSFRAWRRLLAEAERTEVEAHPPAAFLAYGALLHAGLFLLATLWTAAPILLLGPCGAP